MTPEEAKRQLDYERPRLVRYRTFAEEYEVEDFETLVALYDIDELRRFLPANPSSEEKAVLRSLIGTRGLVGYMDYAKSNHTFELIMRWQEKTQNFEENALFFTKKDQFDDHS